jgi:hypothetical protein
MTRYGRDGKRNNAGEQCSVNLVSTAAMIAEKRLRC